MSKKTLAVLGAVILFVALATSGVISRFLGKTAVRALSAEMPDDIAASALTQVSVQKIGQFSVQYYFPLVLNEAENSNALSKFTPELRNKIRSLLTYSGRASCGLDELRLTIWEFAPNFEGNLDNAAAGSANLVSTLEGITNPNVSIVPTIVSGYPARRVSYRANRWGGVLGLETVAVYDRASNFMWQFQLGFSAKKTTDFSLLNAASECAHQVLESVSISS